MQQWLSELDLTQGHALIFCPNHQGQADVFLTVFDADRTWTASPYDTLVKRMIHRLGRQGVFARNAYSIAVKVIKRAEPVRRTAISRRQF